MSKRRSRRKNKNKTVVRPAVTPPPVPLPDVGIVVVGQNNESTLEACLKSIESRQLPTCYVDAGSTDDSVAISERLGVEVIKLSDAMPFTAARARNAGFGALVHSRPHLEFVQMIDADTELQPDWLDGALQEMAENSRIAAVVGRRRERFPDASVYNGLCDMEWNTPLGETETLCADALYRVSAWRDASGYDASLTAAAHLDMSQRLRSGGWSIRRIDVEMTLHDAQLSSFSQWWARSQRVGHAYRELADHPELRDEHSGAIWSARLWAAIIPLLLMASAIVGATVTPWALFGLTLLAGYPLLWWQERARRIRLGDAAAAAGRFARHAIIGRFATLVGMIRAPQPPTALGLIERVD